MVKPSENRHDPLPPHQLCLICNEPIDLSRDYDPNLLASQCCSPACYLEAERKATPPPPQLPPEYWINRLGLNLPDDQPPPTE